MDQWLGFNTASVILSGSAVIASTFFKHFTQRKKVTKDVEIRNDLAFDEAFSVVKAFFEKASLHTVEETQKFGNNFVPAPFWIRVIRVTVPLQSRLDAGKIIIDTLGEEEIQRIVGGREWWQRTAEKSGGVKGEWISMKRDWQGLDGGSQAGHDHDPEDSEDFDEKRAEKLRKMKESAKRSEKKHRKEGKDAEQQWQKEEGKKSQGRKGRKKQPRRSEDTIGPDHEPTTDEEIENEEEYSTEMDEMRCTLYIHGGAYFFGSINTHRYVIWRMARKMGGRAFGISYRLAPQYPFPCALQDALASYLYLIQPPPGAKHRPVDPAKLTIAGDSAGGGLTLALLCLIRDAGLPAPAGAMLISPWCDLTHSFPSILQNTETDIIPPYGFLFKPSTLWPPPPTEFQERAASATTIESLKKAEEARQEKKRGSLFTSRASKKGEDMAKDAVKDGKKVGEDPNESNPHKAEEKVGPNGGKKEATAEVGKILKVKIDGEEVEVRDQIQLYATNEQLVYPFVSPAWQPSLGGLPPLYIMCGDKEVLRDEIIYMAHRAANPSKYPLRQALLDANPERTKKHAAYGPTKVHLQVYDDACHDLPLFSFVEPAKYCYRAVASFAKWVTADARDETPLSPVSPTGMSLPAVDGGDAANHIDLSRLSSPVLSPDSRFAHERPTSLIVPPVSGRSSTDVSPTPSIRRAKSGSNLGQSFNSFLNRSPSLSKASSKEEAKLKDLDKTIYSSLQPFNRPPFVDNMIRERVSITGVVRPLESVDDIPALHMDPNEIGLVKEGPVRRYLTGKAMWDKRFKKTYEHVQKRREHHLHKSQREESSRIRKRLNQVRQRKSSLESSSRTSRTDSTDDVPQTESPEPLDGVEGIWELHGERPPPSSIAARKDTYEARQLAHALDEHYSKIHSLHLWTDLQDLGKPMLPQVREDSEPPPPPPPPAGVTEAMNRLL